MKALRYLAIALIAFSCQAQTQENKGPHLIDDSPSSTLHKDKEFQTYWYGGQAEISRYELQQARYGEVHNGDVVLVFVTEDFLTEEQVKNESGRENSVPILKLNLVKKFPTGIYDYSMMNSVFSPVDLNAYPHPLKVSSSSQEWCGHTYTQINLRGDKYNVEGRSYFEQEVNEDFELPGTYLEDELLTRIRLNPATLPQGKVNMVPGTMTSRLRHIPLRAEMVETKLEKYTGSDYPGEKLMQYTIAFSQTDRSLSIVFEQDFPHQIAGWEENYMSGWGAGAKRLQTKAVRTHQIMSDYWSRNSLEDQKLRAKLGLTE